MNIKNLITELTRFAGHKPTIENRDGFNYAVWLVDSDYVLISYVSALLASTGANFRVRDHISLKFYGKVTANVDNHEIAIHVPSSVKIEAAVLSGLVQRLT